MKVLNKFSVVTTNYEISGQDIIDLLKKAGKIPAKATIEDIIVRVPGGGDWSNTDLDLFDEPVIIRTKEESIAQQS